MAEPDGWTVNRKLVLSTIEEFAELRKDVSEIKAAVAALTVKVGLVAAFFGVGGGALGALVLLAVRAWK